MVAFRFMFTRVKHLVRIPVEVLFIERSTPHTVTQQTCLQTIWKCSKESSIRRKLGWSLGSNPPTSMSVTLQQTKWKSRNFLMFTKHFFCWLFCPCSLSSDILPWSLSSCCMRVQRHVIPWSGKRSANVFKRYLQILLFNSVVLDALRKQAWCHETFITCCLSALCQSNSFSESSLHPELVALQDKQERFHCNHGSQNTPRTRLCEACLSAPNYPWIKVFKDEKLFTKG
jgi:hypothetical protein